MYKPRNYESTQEFGVREPLQLGGHVCKICKVTETTSRNGKPMAVIWLDIAEGEQKGYYTKMWQSGDRHLLKRHIVIICHDRFVIAQWITNGWLCAL